MLRRIIDFSVSLLGLIFLQPLFLLIAALIKLDSKGPVIYRGDRVGMNERRFKILKFRTMEESPEAYDGPRVTATSDLRITRFGRFLRDTKLNELLQLFNVLKGDMSLVGPRPEDPSFMEQYSEEHREVLSVRPGITSLASVIFADEENLLSKDDVAGSYIHSILPKKLRLDLIYIRNRSFLLDLDILLRTFIVLVPRFRKATIHAEDILSGPIRIFRRNLTWFSIDAAIAFTAVTSAGLIWRVGGPLRVGVGQSILAALLITFLFTLSNWLTGVQRVQWRYASSNEAAWLIIAVVPATLILLLVNSAMQERQFPPEMLIVAGVFSLSGFLLARYQRRLIDGFKERLVRLRRTPMAAREKVLVVGAGEAGQLTLWLLQNSPIARAFHVVGVIDDDFEKLGTMVHRVPVMGMCERIPEIVEQGNIGTIIFAIHSIDPERRYQILKDCWKTNARTVVAPDILTFLLNGSDRDDYRMRVPMQAGLVQRTSGSEDHSEKMLKERIRVLAQLAHLGDYATLTEQLQDLDREIVGEDAKRLDEVEEPTLTVDSEVRK